MNDFGAEKLDTSILLREENGGMDITIRNETEKDHRIVEELTREAFWNLYSPGCNEHYLVHKMREHSDFLRELDFIAEYDGKIVGSILYTKAWLIDERGKEMDIVSFGPLSVLPEYQRKGIGSALISHTKDIAKRNGVKAMVILGDPHNYCKHGFKSSKDLNISDINGNYPYGMLAIELEGGALAGRKWKYRYSDVYEINEKDADEYDSTFVRKDRGYRYTQDIFSIAFRSYVK
jgi:predicted N-acetyltransferase YhbS